jgi:aerobic carbon-monoxide dehydrogenase medium subunit
VYPVEFGYLRAQSAAEALEVLADAAAGEGMAAGSAAADTLGEGEIKVLAGGQSLLPMMKLRLVTPATLLDIGGLAELSAIRGERGTIGALATYRSVQRDATMTRRFPAMADALRVLADPAVRARGTIGGAIAHADPAADLSAVLLALDAEITLARRDGSRTVPLDDFLLGAYETVLAEDELVTEITIPAAPAGQAYEKFEQPASHLPLAGVCAAVELSDGVITSARIAVTGVAGRAFRARAAEAALIGKAPGPGGLDAALVREGAPRPLADIHASGEFRLHLAGVLAGRALRRAIGRASDR